MGVKITGLNGLKKLQKNVKDLEGKKSVPFEDLFTDKYLIKNSNFKNFEDFINQEIFKTYESIEAIPDDEMDEFIRSNSKFQSWQEFLDVASKEYVIKKLGF